MYLRSTPRRNKDGPEVRYLQLAHHVWDPQKPKSTVHVVYNFGREDAADREALQRLAASVTRTHGDIALYHPEAPGVRAHALCARRDVGSAIADRA
jgi:hypothetical protein